MRSNSTGVIQREHLSLGMGSFGWPQMNAVPFDLTLLAFDRLQVTRGKKAGGSKGLVLTAVRLKLTQIKQAATEPVRSLRLTVFSPTMYGDPYLL